MIAVFPINAVLNVLIPPLHWWLHWWLNQHTLVNMVFLLKSKFYILFLLLDPFSVLHLRLTSIRKYMSLITRVINWCDWMNYCQRLIECSVHDKRWSTSPRQVAFLQNRQLLAPIGPWTTRFGTSQWRSDQLAAFLFSWSHGRVRNLSLPWTLVWWAVVISWRNLFYLYCLCDHPCPFMAEWK